MTMCPGFGVELVEVTIFYVANMLKRLEGLKMKI